MLSEKAKSVLLEYKTMVSGKAEMDPKLKESVLKVIDTCLQDPSDDNVVAVVNVMEDVAELYDEFQAISLDSATDLDIAADEAQDQIKTDTKIVKDTAEEMKKINDMLEEEEKKLPAEPPVPQASATPANMPPASVPSTPPTPPSFSVPPVSPVPAAPAV